MPSSIFGKVKLRLTDAALSALRRPNRIDTAASVAPTARITSSSLHGPVEVADFAKVHEAEISGPVTIGANTSLWGPGILVYTKKDPIEIGNFCSVARGVCVHGHFHDATRISTHYVGRNVLGRDIEEEVVSRGVTRIGHDVWIGAGVHVMAGVTIGTGAVIGAGSVVARDVPPYAIAVGSPATPLRLRFSEEVVERLLESRWWEWSRERIRANEALFTEPLTLELLERHL